MNVKINLPLYTKAEFKERIVNMILRDLSDSYDDTKKIIANEPVKALIQKLVNNGVPAIDFEHLNASLPEVCEGFGLFLPTMLVEYEKEYDNSALWLVSGKNAVRFALMFYDIEFIGTEPAK